MPTFPNTSLSVFKGTSLAMDIYMCLKKFLLLRNVGNELENHGQERFRQVIDACH